MDKEHFEQRLKIACFKSITNQLRERCLITREEFKKIHKYLEQMEIDTIAAKPVKSRHSRQLTVVK